MRAVILLSLSFGLLVSPAAFAQEAKKPSTPEPDRAELEKQFAETLSGSALVGSFSIVGRDNKTPKTERYHIASVKKLEGDYWLFNARIQYGKTDVTLPLRLKVLWAGDTPVITLTDLAIPGLGTFTSRVMIYRGRYSGTWQHDAVGGHLWGVIEKAPAQDPSS